MVRGMDYCGVALTVRWAGGREWYCVFCKIRQRVETKMDKKRTDSPYFPLSEKTESPPLNFLAGGNPPEE